ncbi:hypothetical protein ACNKHS_03500 [Shigella flexneri]
MCLAGCILAFALGASPQKDRMGYRLQGQFNHHHRELLSHGSLPGVVQVPHNGQPIVLMNDAHTTWLPAYCLHH